MLLQNWARFGPPDLRRILGNGAVARKLAAAGNIQDGLVRPRPGIGVQCAEPVLRLAIGSQVGQVHIVVAVLEEYISQRIEDAGFTAIEVAGEDQVESRLRLRLVLVMPIRAIPASAA